MLNEILLHPGIPRKFFDFFDVHCLPLESRKLERLHWIWAQATKHRSRDSRSARSDLLFTESMQACPEKHLGFPGFPLFSRFIDFSSFLQGYSCVIYRVCVRGRSSRSVKWTAAFPISRPTRGPDPWRMHLSGYWKTPPSPGCLFAVKLRSTKNDSGGSA